MSAVTHMALLAKSTAEINVTWDPSNKGTSVTLSNSNYDAIGANTQCVRATKGVSGSQKAYWEVVVATAFATGGRAGSMNHSTYSNYMTSTSQAGGFRPEATSFLSTGITAGSTTNLGGAFTNGDVIMFALDMGAGKLWVGLNNLWINSGNPAAGTNHQYSGLTGTHYPGADYVETTEKWRIRGNTSLLTYSPPSGFTVLGAL